MSFSPVSTCCGPVRDKFVNVAAKDIEALAGKLRTLQEPPWSAHFVYQCRRCGQLWEAHLVSFMHADVEVVVKAGVEPTLDP